MTPQGSSASLGWPAKVFNDVIKSLEHLVECLGLVIGFDSDHRLTLKRYVLSANDSTTLISSLALPCGTRVPSRTR